MIINVSKETFHEMVEQSEKPVLVEFWAPWCVYCQKLSPILDMLSDKRGDALPICKINTDEQNELASQLDVEFIPTLYIYKNGSRSEKLVAPTSVAQLEEWLNQHAV